MIETIRRVVTGETDDGRAVFTHVEEVTPLTTSEMRWFGVWGWDDPPTFPYLATDPYVPRSVFPHPSGRGLRVNAVEFAPGVEVAKQTDTADPGVAGAEEYGRLSRAEPAGFALDPTNGMHATDGVDIGIVLSGEVCLEQDGGEEVVLRPGDVYVQNGATHAWRNRSDKPCMVVFMLMPFGGRTAPRKLPEGLELVNPPADG